MRPGHAEALDRPVCEREDDVARRDLAHGFAERTRRGPQGFFFSAVLCESLRSLR
jgi:hypothetical protein